MQGKHEVFQISLSLKIVKCHDHGYTYNNKSTNSELSFDVLLDRHSGGVHREKTYRIFFSTHLRYKSAGVSPQSFPLPIGLTIWSHCL